MGETHSNEHSKETIELKTEEELKIIQNDINYNIKLNLEENNSVKNIKMTISFSLNDDYYTYEEYISQFLEKEEAENMETVYLKLIELIKKEKIEIKYDNMNKPFLFVNINIDTKIKTIKLNLINNEKEQLKKLIKKNYLQLKNNSEENLNIHFDDEDDDERIFDNNSEGSKDLSIEDKGTNLKKIDENHISLNLYNSIWCMIKLNTIFDAENNENLDLIAIGFTRGKIIIINLPKREIHQEINTNSNVFSITQFENYSKYLICSLSDGKVIIYILKGTNYEIHQTLEKPSDIKRGEMYKVITLSDGNLATAERGAVSIWKSMIKEGEKKFEFYEELITDEDTCQLLEVNPQILVCAIYNSKLINVYKKIGDDYILYGKIPNVESHGSNSNGMSKINENIFCSGGAHSNIYIVSVEPVQVIQTIFLDYERFDHVHFLHNSNNGFIFTSLGYTIIQLKIINDEDGNFIKLEKFDEIKDGHDNESIVTMGDKIFYRKKNFENMDENYLFCYTNYKIN